MAGLYIHIPFCKSKCGYCAFYSEPVDQYDTSKLTSAILCELDSYSRGELAESVKTIYIGGGTPSCIPHEELFAIVERAGEICCNVSEFTVEANPAQIDSELAGGLIERNINRLSIGAQSFVEKELKLLGRIHTVDDIKRAFETARQAGFGNISLDLIFAVCGSGVEDFRESLEAAVSLGPEHVSAYSLSIEPGTKFASAVAEKRLAVTDEETDLEMYELAIDTLEAAGLMQYEISNFARPGFECRHNLGCWRNEPYIGIGPAAWSYYKGRRYANAADINSYVELVEKGKTVVCESHTPNKNEIACETAVLNLRTRKGIDACEFKEVTGFGLFDIFGETIRSNVNAGMLEYVNGQEGNVRLTRKALAVADKVLCQFAAI